MMKKIKQKKGQSIIEYVVLFSVVVAIVIVASTAVIGPALNGLYDRTADSLAHVNTDIP